ncbi:MAG: ECF transporter S component [Acholeplasmataceae bacterium]|nr:ECF transporter S component [Acholeplasmataceae bacterium]
MKRNQVRDLALTSVFAAIILVMTFVPSLGYILIGITELTLIHIPVLIGVFLLPIKHSIVLGLIFGLGSMLKAVQVNTGLAIAFINPLVSILPRLIFVILAILIFKGLKLVFDKSKKGDVYIFGFVSLISIVSVFYASNAIATFTGWNTSWLNFVALVITSLLLTFYFGFIKGESKDRVLYPSVMLISTVVHTLLVLFSILLFSKQLMYDLFQTEDVIGILVTIAVTNGLVEALLAAIIGTPIIIALKQIQER